MNLTTTSINPIKTCFMHHEEFEAIVGFPSKSHLASHIITCVVNSILTISTVFLNSATVIAYWKSSQLKKKVSYFLVTVLSFNDLGVGMIGGPLFTLLLANSLAGIGSCWLKFAARKISMLTTGMSIMTLSVLNMERYLGVLHPIVHRSKVTRKRLLVSLTFTWLCWIIMFCMSFVDERPLTIYGLVYTSSFLVTGVYFYTKIFLAARLSRRIIVQSYICNTSTRNPSEMIEKRRLLQDVKLAKSCFAVVICFFVCLAPICIVTIVNISSFDGLLLYNWSVTFLMMNSSLNSVVLVWRNRTLRNDILRVVKELFRCL